MKILAALCLFSLLGVLASAATSDGDIKAAIIRESIASYPSVCACPYSTMRNGRACGGRSAWSKPGGYAPLCYDRDVTPELIRQYRASHGR